MIELYTGVDLLPLQWKLSADEVDVHMIAIATESDDLPPGNDANAVVINDDDHREYPWEGADDDEWMYGDDNAADFGWDDAYRGRRELSSERRRLPTQDVSQIAWTVYNAPLGFCDGSAQSTCNRIVSNPCLLANYNYYRAGLMGHGQSGKLKLSIPYVKEGLVLVRFEWDLGLPDSPKMENLPEDFIFEYTVNGETTKQNRSMFAAATVEVTPGLRLHTLLKDYEMSQTEGEVETVDIEMEVRSESMGTKPLVLISHIYYA